MKITGTSIKDSFIITPDVIEDNRGFFYRALCRDELKRGGIDIDEIVQVNYSFNKNKGTFRGFHFQYPPFTEEKIVKCIKGEVMDIILDLRKGSGTFLKYDAVVLSEKNKRSVLIPKGCAHGFITLAENCELTYLHTQYYKPEYESGVSIFDPMLKMPTPIEMTEISERDRNRKFLPADFTGIEI
jgi:dTDP-4-dehydrorhamnose 3,5-epimerase